MRSTAERPAAVATGSVGIQMDAIIAIAFAALTVITRFPFRSLHAFNWDAVNFVLALSDYDVRLHHPQPPGYPVFVATLMTGAIAAPVTLPRPVVKTTTCAIPARLPVTLSMSLPGVSMMTRPFCDGGWA